MALSPCARNLIRAIDEYRTEYPHDPVTKELSTVEDAVRKDSEPKESPGKAEARQAFERGGRAQKPDPEDAKEPPEGGSAGEQFARAADVARERLAR